jgi:hypothetical protein
MPVACASRNLRRHRQNAVSPVIEIESLVERRRFVIETMHKDKNASRFIREDLLPTLQLLDIRE